VFAGTYDHTRILFTSYYGNSTEIKIEIPPKLESELDERNLHPMSSAFEFASSVSIQRSNREIQIERRIDQRSYMKYDAYS